MLNQMLKPHIAGLLTVLMLAACATPIKYEDYLATYHGNSEAQIRAAWGEPAQREVEDYQTILIYRTSGTQNVMVAPAIYEPYFDGKNVHHRIVQAERWNRVTVHCETRFVLEDDQVVQMPFKGDGCYAK